jgi:hypothetical protein
MPHAPLRTVGGWSNTQEVSGMTSIHVSRICLQCGKEFFITPTRAIKGEGKYCSWQCRREATAAKPRVENEPRCCLHCGKVFRPRVNTARFCSPTCSNKSRARPIEERFWERVDISGGPDACWPWTAGTHDFGYGKLATGEGDKHVYAHRFSYELHHGPIPEGMAICHNCPTGDNPLCCNPRHLFLGTQGDNMRDMTAKGRRRAASGEDQRNAILTWDKVREMRADWAAGKYPSWAALGRAFGVNPNTARQAVLLVTWRE